LISIPYYLKKFSDEYRFFQESLKLQNVNQSTRLHFSKIWYRNYILNFHTAQKETYILDLASKFLEDQIVVFAGASPSLEREVSNLKKYRKKFWLLSSDTSAFFLVKNNLIPDAILSLDSGRGTIYHFRYELPQDIPILTWFGANRELFFRNYRKYIFFTTYPLDQLLQSLCYPNLFTLKNPSLNIAGLAKSLCIALGAKKLFFVGTSFLLEQGKSHCRGTGYESYMLPFVSRKKSLEGYRTGYKQTMSPKNELARKEIFSGEFASQFNEFEISNQKDFVPKSIPTQTQKNVYSFLQTLTTNTQYLQALSIEINLPISFLIKYLKLL